jgi:raffinose/stachyose/melibiose transport system substrate-binding protein
MKRFALVLLAALLVLGVFPVMAGGGQQGASGSGRIVLNLMHHNTVETIEQSIETRAFHELKERYIKAHPEVQLNETIFQQVDNHTRMMALAAANNMPDIYMTKGSWVENFYLNDLMADLTPYINRSIYRPGLTDPMIRDNKLYCVPIQLVLTSLVYWNEALWRSIGFNEFPKTWEELVRADALFKARGIVTMAHGNKDRWMIGSCILSTMGDRFTGSAWTQSIIANDGRARFTDPEFVTALRYIQQMASMFNRDFNAINNDQCYEIYANGRAASVTSGSWAISFMLTHASDDVIRNTKYAILPSVPNMKGDPNSTSGGAWGMSASSKLSGDSLKAAATFLDYVSGREYSQFMMDFNGSLGPVAVPVNTRINMPELNRNFIDFIGRVNMIPVYDLTMEGAVIDFKNSLLQDLLAGNLTPESVAASVQGEQDRLPRRSR